MRKALERLVFIDETWLKTNLVKTTGWAPVGERLIDHAPFGHWNTQTFIAALRCDGLTAPWVFKGAINRDLFNAYVETQLAPTLNRRDLVILDNLSSHKSPQAAEVLKSTGARFVFGENCPLDSFLIPQTPAALQPGPQSHREGLLQAQDPDP